MSFWLSIKSYHLKTYSIHCFKLMLSGISVNVYILTLSKFFPSSNSVTWIKIKNKNSITFVSTTALDFVSFIFFNFLCNLEKLKKELILEIWSDSLLCCCPNFFFIRSLLHFSYSWTDADGMEGQPPVKKVKNIYKSNFKSIS